MNVPSAGQPSPAAEGALSAAAEAAFRTLAHAGTIDQTALDDGSVGGQARLLSGEAGRENLGTRVRFDVLVRGSCIARVRFRAYGCPHTLAACEWLAQRLEGQVISDGFLDNPMSWANYLEIPEYKLGRLLIVEDALRAALLLPPKAA